MAKQHTMNVSLTPVLARQVQARVQSGKYATASEVVREGLRLLAERDKDRAAALRDLRKSLRKAERQIDETGGISSR